MLIPYRQQISTKIAELIEKHEGFPSSSHLSAGRFFNPASSAVYRGCNAINLVADSLEKGFTDPRWMTFKQAAAAGLSVKKGAKASRVEYWDWTAEKFDENGNVIETEAPRAKAFYVALFNAEEINGIEPYKQPERNFDQYKVIDDLYNAIVTEDVSDSDPSQKGYVGITVQLKCIVQAVARANPEILNKDQATIALTTQIAIDLISTQLGLDYKYEQDVDHKLWQELILNDHSAIFRVGRDVDYIVDEILARSPELTQEFSNVILDNQLGEAQQAKLTQESELLTDLSQFMPVDVSLPKQDTPQSDIKQFWNEIYNNAKKEIYKDEELAQIFNDLEEKFDKFKIFEEGLTKILQSKLDPEEYMLNTKETITSRLVERITEIGKMQNIWTGYKEKVIALAETEGFDNDVVEAALHNQFRDYAEIVNELLLTKNIPLEVKLSIMTRPLANTLPCDDISLLDSNCKEFIRQVITVYYTDSPYGEKFLEGIKKSEEPVEESENSQKSSNKEQEEIILQVDDETIELST